MDKIDRSIIAIFVIVMVLVLIFFYHWIGNVKDISKERTENIRTEAYSMGYRDAVRDLNE